MDFDMGLCFCTSSYLCIFVMYDTVLFVCATCLKHCFLSINLVAWVTDVNDGCLDALSIMVSIFPSLFPAMSSCRYLQISYTWPLCKTRLTLTWLPRIGPLHHRCRRASNPLPQWAIPLHKLPACSRPCKLFLFQSKTRRTRLQSPPGFLPDLRKVSSVWVDTSKWSKIYQWKAM